MPDTSQNSENRKKSAVMLSSSRSFAPLARDDARILILGSLPGQRSLQEQQYYAHPQNAFWRIMYDLIGVDGHYQQRCQALVDNEIALWDVLAESVRPGSLDSDIRLDTARPNDLESLLRQCPKIQRVCFNGQKAAQLYAKYVRQGELMATMTLVTLPSTSPAYAAMPYEEKLTRWRAAFDEGR